MKPGGSFCVQILEDSKKMLEQEVSHLKEQLSLADTKKNQELQVNVEFRCLIEHNTGMSVG